MKRRSGARTLRPLESYTFFVDENLGRKLAAALMQQGLTAITHVDEPEGLPRSIDDAEWAARVGRDGWIALTKDNETRYKPNERETIVREKARVLQFTRGPWTSGQMIEAFTLAKPRIRRLLDKYPGPLIARINKKGEITRVFTEIELTRTVVEEQEDVN